MNVSVETLQEVDEVGPRIANSIQEFFAEPRNRDLVKRLGKYLNFKGEKNNVAPRWPERLS